MCGCWLSDLSFSEALKETCSSPPCFFFFQIPTLQKETRDSVLIGPTATHNEFLLNAMVTITHPSSHLLLPFPVFSPFVSERRQTARQPIAIRAAVCQAAFK